MREELVPSDFEHSLSNCEEEEEEEEEEEDLVVRCSTKQAYTTERPTVHVVDYSPGLLFEDTTECTLDALVQCAAELNETLDVVRLSEEEYEAHGWPDKLGQLHLFPAFVLTCASGGFVLPSSAFGQTYIMHKLFCNK